MLLYVAFEYINLNSFILFLASDPPCFLFLPPLLFSCSAELFSSAMATKTYTALPLCLHLQVLTTRHAPHPALHDNKGQLKA